MGKKLTRSDVEQCLINADGAAIDEDEPLEIRHATWIPDIAFLGDEKKCPSINYLGVLAVALVARSLKTFAELDVFAIKASEDRGYAAPSIAVRLTPFASQRGINLRTTSSNLMNAQPFFGKVRILPDLSDMRSAERDPGSKWTDSYTRLYQILGKVQNLSKEEAKGVLALLFRIRKHTGHRDEKSQMTGGRKTWKRLCKTIDAFVNDTIAGGRVGQAFVTAALSVAYPKHEVTTSLVNDPSFGAPGDVTISATGTDWLYGEVRQKGQTTEDIIKFAKQVKDAGVDRALFAALANHKYSATNVDFDEIEKCERTLEVSIQIYESPYDLLEFVERFSPGDFNLLSSNLTDQMLARLREQGCNSELIDTFKKRLSA